MFSFPVVVAGLSACFLFPAPANRAPVLEDPGDVVGVVGEPLELTFVAEDPNRNDALTFELTEGPADAVLSGDQLLWIPALGDVGLVPFAVTVTDNGEPPLTDSVAFVVTVQEELTPTAPGENRPPVADPVAPRTVGAGESIDLALTATDPDNDTLAWSSPSLPDGATLTPTGTFRWTPPGPGAFTIDFTVTDDGDPPLSDTTSFDVDVVDGLAGLTLNLDATYAVDTATAIPAGACVELLDPTPAVVGGTPTWLASTTVGANGSITFTGVTTRPGTGYFVAIEDCTGSADLGIPPPPSSLPANM